MMLLFIYSCFSNYYELITLVWWLCERSPFFLTRDQISYPTNFLDFFSLLLILWKQTTIVLYISYFQMNLLLYTKALMPPLSFSLSLSQFTKFPNILSFQFYNIIARTQLNRRPNRIEPPSCFKKNVQKIVECENRTRVHYDNRLSHNHRTKIIIS